MKYLYILSLLAIISSCAVAPDTFVNYDKAVKFNNYTTYAWLPQDARQCEKAASTVYCDLFNNDITISNIKKTANAELLSKGFKINIDTPDFLIQYKIIFEKKEHIVNAPVISDPNAFAGTINNLQPYTNVSGVAVPNTYNRLSGTYTVYSNNTSYLPGGNIFAGGGNNVNTGLNGGSYNGYFNNNNTNGNSGNGNAGNAPVVVSNYFEKTDYNEGTVIVDVIDRKTNTVIWRGWSQSEEENPATVEASITAQIRHIITKFPQ